MATEILLELLLKTAAPLLGHIAKTGVGALVRVPPVSKAIEATAEGFPLLPALRYTLSTWCASEGFVRILERVKAGSRDMSQEAVVDSFIGAADFFAGDNSRLLAEQILNTFLLKLEQQLYATNDGLFLHARREEWLHETTHHNLSTLDARLADLRGDVRELAQRLPRSDDERGAAADADQLSHAKVDAARDLINQGRAHAARSLLEGLQRELAGQSPSAGLQFRIRTNLGACAMRLGDFDAADRLYTSAVALQPRNPKALANAAMAKLVLQRAQEAIELTKIARKVSPREPHVTSIHLQALYQSGRVGQLEELVKCESWIEKEQACALALAHIRLQQQRYGDAEAFARNAVDGGFDDVQAYLLLGEAIVAPVQQALRSDPPLRSRMPADLRTRLIEGETAYSSAVGLLKNSDPNPLMYQALCARAAVRGMLERFEDALADLDTVLAQNPQNSQALQNRPFVLLHLGRRPEAIQGLERLARDHAADLLLATAYLDEGAPEKAIALVAPRYQAGRSDEQQLALADILLSAYAATQKNAEGEELARAVGTTWPNDSDALSALGRYRSRQGKAEDAIALFREALAYASGHGRDRAALELARAYDAVGRYSEAAELYGQVIDTNTDDPQTRRYLVALYHAGSYREALTLARTLRGAGNVIPVVSEVEAIVLERIGDLDGAIDLLTKLSCVEPSKMSHRLHIALLQLRRGHRDEARSTLSEIHPNELTDSRTLLQAAQARSILRMPDVLLFAHRARRLDFGNPDVHLAYVSLFLARENPDKDLLEVDRVGIDCTVQLKHSDENKTFTIIDEVSPNRERGELPPSDPLAQKLLGMTKGSIVVLRDGPLEELFYEIADIKSKYVYAFQETLATFSTWFPEHSGLQRVRMPDGDVSRILRTLDTRHEYASRVIGLYRDGQLSLGAFARLVGVSVIDIWGGLANMAGGIILASAGLADQNQREAALVASARQVVLDLTALLTLAYVRLLDRLPQRFDRLLVPQALLDDIDELLATNFARSGSSMSVWKEGEQYVRHERSPEDRERDKHFIENLREFIKDQCIVTPTTAALEFARPRLTELQDVLGRGALASILLSKEHGLPLYADDLGLRAIAKNEWQAEGFWTQTLLIDLRSSQIISDDEYHDAIRKLVMANYRFVSIDGAGFYWIIKASDFDTSSEVNKVLGSVRGPDCTEESAVSVLSELLRHIWMEPILYHKKLSLLDVLLQVLTTGRNTERVIMVFKAAVRDRFALAPLVVRPIFDAIDVWHRRLRVERGLIDLP
jgi:tetratricopeptide (TPR) repeat protein